MVLDELTTIESKKALPLRFASDRKRFHAIVIERRSAKNAAVALQHSPIINVVGLSSDFWFRVS